MKKITISDLCNQASTIIDQVFAGEHLTVTRDGHAVVELNPIPREPIEVAALLERWRATILIRPLQPTDVAALLELLKDYSTEKAVPLKDGTPLDRISKKYSNIVDS